MDKNNLKKYRQVLPIACIVFAIVLILSSCTSVQELPPPLFQSINYPNEKYFVGSATVHGDNIGIDKESAKKQALLALASQIQTKITSYTTAISLHDDNHSSNSMESCISEELTQEFEEIQYIEELYSQATGQTTYAILNKDAWEGQKARKTLAAKQKADEILSSRYPDMQKAEEVTILKNARESLQSTIWGPCVEGMIDGKYRQYLTAIETRRDSLITQLVHSPYAYVSEGISKISLLDAKQIARTNLEEGLKTELIKESRTSWVQAEELIDLGKFLDQIDEYVSFHLLLLTDQISVFEGKESQQGNYQQFVTLDKKVWKQIQTEEKETLKKQVELELSSITEQQNFNETMQSFYRIQDVLSQYFMGPSIREHEQPEEQSYLQLIREKITSYLNVTGLEIQTEKEIEEGQYLTVSVHAVQSGRSLSFIPVELSICNADGNILFTDTKPLDIQESVTFTFLVPKKSDTENLTLYANLVTYPKIKTKSLVNIKKVGLVDKLRKMIFGNNQSAT
ncbi:hypothetical protein SpiGrapes_3065 [Sphaerochaeta pleomorpha str. Grapes]|uniref:LPP20 lipoprotein n=2 Tax=Sphaerochaeta TaxID=399320 RepID=G8QYG5_SPHPG|nr:hypothetical protein SpiGrapes_3065 [Sphaerochaeta pleomorpha str. Grapes]